MFLRALTTDQSGNYVHQSWPRGKPEIISTNAKFDKLATSWKAALKRDRALDQWRYLKRWPKHDKVFVDLRFFQAREAILLKDVDILDDFFVDFESSRPPFDYDVVRKFFRTYRPADTVPGSPKAWAKLDARDFAQKTKRAYSQWLTPADLYRSLTVKVCKHGIKYCASYWPVQRFEAEQQQAEDQLDIRGFQVAGQLETQTRLEDQYISQAEPLEGNKVSDTFFSNADRQIM